MDIQGPSEWMMKSMIISKGQCLKLFRKFLFLQDPFPNFNQMLSLFIDWFWHESKCQSKANIFVFSIVFVYFNYLLIGLILKTNLVHFYHYFFLMFQYQWNCHTFYLLWWFLTSEISSYFSQSLQMTL